MSKKKASGRRTRRLFSSEFKAKVALSALREDKTMAELCQQYELHPNQINDWKKLLLERTAELFDRGAAPEPVDLKPLHAKIGQQALELDFLNSALTKAGLLSAGPDGQCKFPRLWPPQTPPGKDVGIMTVRR